MDPPDWKPGDPPIPRDEAWWDDYERRSKDVPTIPNDWLDDDLRQREEQ